MGFKEGKEGEVYARLVAKMSPKCEDDLIEAIEQFLPRGCNPKLGEILVDVPLKPRLRRPLQPSGEAQETQQEAGTRSKLWVCLRTHLTKELRSLSEWPELLEYSPLAAGLGRLEDVSGRLIRVFFSRSLLKRLSHQDLRKVEQQLLKHIDISTRTW